LSELRVLINIISVAIVIFVAFRAFGLVWEKKPIPLYKTYLIIAAVGIMHFLNITFFLNTFQFFIIAVAAYFLLTFLYEGSKAHRLLFTCLVYCIFIACEIIVGMLLKLLSGLTVEETQTNLLFYFQGGLYSNMLRFLLITLLSMNLKSKFGFISRKLIFTSFITAISSIMITGLILFFAYRETNQIAMFLIIIATSLLVFSNLFLVTLMERQAEMEATKQRLLFIENQIHTQTKHFDELSALQDETRQIWHDMNNKLIGVSEYIKLNENDKALAFIESMAGQVSKLMLKADTGCPAIDAVLKFKIKKAEDNGCYLDYFTQLPEKVYIDEIDIAILIANALDNAIEYHQRIQVPNKKIKLNIVTHSEYISIKIENQVSENIDVDHLITHKNNALYHGYGLENIKRIAERYEGDLHLSCQNNRFVVSVLLKNIKCCTLST
jgi:hypothetical protein